MTVQVIKARWIVTCAKDDTTPVIHEHAALARQDGVIVAVGPASQILKDDPAAPVTDYPQHLIRPGPVNGHHHIGLAPLQLGAPDYALELWFAARLSMRKIDPYLDTLYSAFEMISSGVTTVQHIQGWATGDLAQVTASAKGVLRAYQAVGMRASWCYAIREQNRFVYESDFIALYDGPLAIKEKSVAEGVPMHMHLLERPYQKEYALRSTGTTAVRHLEKLGLLGLSLTLGHGVWMTEEDLGQLVPGAPADLNLIDLKAITYVPLDAAFAHDGPSVVEVRIDDRATPIHSFKRRMREGADAPRPRPGTVYKLREWKISPDLD